MAGRARVGGSAAVNVPPVATATGAFSDSDSSLDMGSDDESQLYVAPAVAAMAPEAARGAAAVADTLVARQGSDSTTRPRRRVSGIPSLISRHGSRSTLSVDNRASRTQEISSQAAAAAVFAAEAGGYNVAGLPPAYSGGAGGNGGGAHHRRISSTAYTNGTSSSLELSVNSGPGGRTIPREMVAAGADEAFDPAGGGGTGGEEADDGGKDSSSEGDMTWEDFLATTDDLGD
ncbi:unnamed protein product, partial [Ectocarpus sp. 8 AP-2014]